MNKPYTRSEESRRRTAEAVRRAHALKPRSPESRALISEKLKQAHREGRAGGFKRGNRCGSQRTPEGLKRGGEAAAKRCRGSHGFGLMKLGRPDHCMAKAWVIESPEGERHSFTNLLEWCRQNEHRFPADPRAAKQPLWHRAAMGIARQQGPAGHRRGKWRGWKLISVSEIQRGEVIPQ